MSTAPTYNEPVRWIAPLTLPHRREPEAQRRSVNRPRSQSLLIAGLGLSNSDAAPSDTLAHDWLWVSVLKSVWLNKHSWAPPGCQALR